MKLKIFKSATLAVLLVAGRISFAQVAPAKPVTPTNPTVEMTVSVDHDSDSDGSSTTNTSTTKTVTVKLNKLKTKLKVLAVNTNTQVIAALSSLNNTINDNIDANKDVDYTVTTHDDNDLVKNYSKVYPVDGNDVLLIDNRFGNVTVNTWNRNEFKVDVQIKVSGSDKNEAQKSFDNVSISDGKNGSTVFFKTVINEVKSSWTSMFHGSSIKKMEINYTVYMPAKNGLTVDNRYGLIILPDLDGRVVINSAYGGLTAKTLSNQSALKVKYGNANIEAVGNCALDLSYGGLNLGSADVLAANVSYSPVKIGRLHNTGSINIKYGDGLQIVDLDKSIHNLAINASYTNISIGLSGDENADFAVSVHYGDFGKGAHSVMLTGDDNPDHMTKNYKGYIGKGNSGKNIAINSSYGNVSFN